MLPLFALVDCNNFYVSCERLMLPKLHGKPVIVLSNNDGCVVARSNEAKALGIAMGVPEFQIRSLIRSHDVQVFSSNYAFYGDMSQRVMEVLEAYSPHLEIYSIDEAFLDCSGVQLKDLGVYAQTIRQTVTQWTGIPVSIGIAETKTLAKVANRLAKRTRELHGVGDLVNSRDRDTILGCFPVEDVWGIGRQSASLLQRYGITTAQQLRDADAHWIRKELGIVGLRIVMELRGQSCLPLEDVPGSRKSLTCARSFGRVIDSLAEMEEAVSSYVSRVGEKLRREQLAASVVTVFLTTNSFTEGPHYCNSLTVPLIRATDSTSDLIRSALQAIRRIYRDGYRYKKAGVTLTGFVPLAEVQTDLFESQENIASKRLHAVIDRMNAKWGANALYWGSNGTRQRWQSQSHRQSPAYTTDWSALPLVIA